MEPYLSRTFFWIDSKASICFSFRPSFSLKVDSPWIYSIISALAACLRDNSASAEHGIIFISGKASCRDFRFSSEPGLSALLAAINIGFVECLRTLAKSFKLSSVHPVGFVGSSFRIVNTLFTSTSFTLRPENCLATVFAKSVLVDWIVRDNFSHTRRKIDAYHLFSSSSSIWTSSIGFPFPSCPSRVVVADMSTIWMNMSACRRSSRNLLPSPFPSEAPFTNPATSIISMGTNRVSPVQNPVLGLHFVFNSLHNASTLT